MARYTLLVSEDGPKLVDNQTNEVVKIFPKNRGRFDNPEWEKYKREHKGLDWELKYAEWL